MQMADTGASDRTALPPVGRGFAAAYTIAQIGAWTSFMPMLSILLPLKAEEIAPDNKAGVLAIVTGCGALVAMFANPIAGALSDMTRTRWGRRKPWLISGAFGTAMSYLLIMSAENVLALTLGLMSFQLVFNCLFAALNIIPADRVPPHQIGWLSGLIGLGSPVGSLVGAQLVGSLLETSEQRYTAIAVLLLATVLPFAVLYRDPTIAATDRRFRLGAFIRSFWVSPFRFPDFGLAWTGKFFFTFSYITLVSFQLYYLKDSIGYERLFPGHTAAEGVAFLTLVSSGLNVIGTLLFGYLASRYLRLKIFTILSCALVALGIAVIAMVPTWHFAILGFAIFGFGVGAFHAVDFALCVEVLPTREGAAKDLGLINLANTFAQFLAPFVAAQIIAFTHDYRMAFLGAALAGFLGAAVIQPIRSVR